MGSVLHTHIVPDVGGDTVFASMYAAYDALSPSMKTMLGDKTAHHSGDAAYRGFYNQHRKYPNADHPVVCIHPDSRRLPLFVNRFYTTRINDLPPRCCMEPVLVVGERAETHMGKPIHSPEPSPCRSNTMLNTAIGFPRLDIGLRTGQSMTLH